MTEKKRIDWVDGLKGVSAVIVAIFHYLLAFKPDGFVGWNCIPSEAEKLDYYFAHFPYSLLTNGPFVLYVFFALIAFIPAYQYFNDRNKERIQRQAKVRYFRLMPAMLILIITSLIFSKLGLYRTDEVSAAIGNPWISALVCDMSLLGAIFDGLIGAYVRGSQYLMISWCMHYIFLGSYLAYAVILIFGDMKNKVGPYIGLFILSFFYPWTLSFTAGIVAADVLTSLKADIKHGSLIGILVMLLGLAIGKIPPVILPVWLSADIFAGIGSLFFLIGIGISAPVISFLSRRIFKILGKYSFSLMFSHTFVLLSISSMLFLKLNELGLSRELNLLICIVVSTPAIALVTWVIEKTVGAVTSFIISRLFKKTKT